NSAASSKPNSPSTTPVPSRPLNPSSATFALPRVSSQRNPHSLASLFSRSLSASAPTPRSLPWFLAWSSTLLPSAIHRRSSPSTPPSATSAATIFPGRSTLTSATTPNPSPASQASTISFPPPSPAKAIPGASGGRPPAPTFSTSSNSPSHSAAVS